MLREATLTRSSPIRSSRSCHDSVNPCLAWARSPTMVKLRDGQRSSSICHSASVSSWASSTTMCANGPASRSGSACGQGGLVDQGVADALLAKLRHHALLVVELEQVVDDPVHLLALGGDGGLVPAPAS